jgi:DNA gyrase subunit A
MVTVDKDHINDSQILVVTENGYGKRTKLVDEDGEDVYRINRGGKGVKHLISLKNWKTNFDKCSYGC